MGILDPLPPRCGQLKFADVTIVILMYYSRVFPLHALDSIPLFTQRHRKMIKDNIPVHRISVSILQRPLQSSKENLLFKLVVWIFKGF